MQQPILIIGAGLGGLALGQGLRKLGIPFQIFERDASIGARLQGYRIRISGEGLDALEQTLLPEVWSELVQTFAREDPSGDFLTLGSRLDLHTGTKLPSPSPPRPQTSSTPARAADRTTTRRVLLQGIESYVTFNKTLANYAIDPSGTSVTAHFSDGTSVTGSLLIGVEGSRSVVRRHYAPNLRILDTEGSAITGKTPWTAELKARLSPYLHQGMSSGKDVVRVDGEENVLTMLVEPFFFDRDAGVKMDLPEQDYVYWGLVSKASSFGNQFAATSEEAAAKSLELTSKWHESVRAVWELQDRSQTMMLRVTMADPLRQDAWGVDGNPQARGRVMIMGDAAHVMSPTGGLGSTAVFTDVARLCGLLRERGLGEDEEQRVGLVRDFEVGMKADAKRFCMFSAMGGKNMFGMREVSELKIVGEY